MFSVGIVTERLESGQDDKHSSPTMIEREWKMDKEFVGSTLGFVILFDNVIDVLKRGGVKTIGHIAETTKALLTVTAEETNSEKMNASKSIVSISRACTKAYEAIPTM